MVDLSFLVFLTILKGQKINVIKFINTSKNNFKIFLIKSRRSSIGTFIRSSQPSSESSATSSQSNKPQKPQAPKMDYKSMVSIDDMPALFVSFDSKFDHDFILLNQIFLPFLASVSRLLLDENKKN